MEMRSIVETEEDALDVYLPEGFESLRPYLTKDPMSYIGDMDYYDIVEI